MTYKQGQSVDGQLSLYELPASHTEHQLLQASHEHLLDPATPG